VRFTRNRKADKDDLQTASLRTTIPHSFGASKSGREGRKSELSKTLVAKLLLVVRLRPLAPHAAASPKTSSRPADPIPRPPTSTNTFRESSAAYHHWRAASTCGRKRQSKLRVRCLSAGSYLKEDPAAEVFNCSTAGHPYPNHSTLKIRKPGVRWTRDQDLTVPSWAGRQRSKRGRGGHYGSS